MDLDTAKILLIAAFSVATVLAAVAWAADMLGTAVKCAWQALRRWRR